VNLDGSLPYVLPYSKTTGFGASQASSQISREERIKQEIDNTDSKHNFIKALPKGEFVRSDNPLIEQIVQACTGENSFLNNARCITVDELTQGLANIGELPPTITAPTRSHSGRTQTKTQDEIVQFRDTSQTSHPPVNQSQQRVMSKAEVIDID
jgi:hypothetical protein